ncbi:MAG: hypothetical protein Q9220_003927 [cf. Caloplaca sp. 1 TL-2023]
MKFMQRAAALSPQSSPQSPDRPPSKRQKISYRQPQSSVQDDHAAAFQIAAQEEAAKRMAAIEQVAARAGETKWVLSTVDDERRDDVEEEMRTKIRFLNAGYSEIDHDDRAVYQRTVQGRRVFGQYVQDDKVIFVPLNQ